MNTSIPADIVEKFQAKYDWLQQKIGTLKGAIEPDIYQTPDGGWQCNYDGEWGYGCAITLRPGDNERLVPFATDPAGNCFVLKNGKIYLWLHEIDKAVFVAESFFVFLEMLHV